MPRDNKIYRQADASSPLLSLGEDQVTEGLVLVWSEVGERHAMGNASRHGTFTWSRCLSRPDYLRLDRDNPSVRLEVDVEPALRWEGPVELYASTLFAHAVGPASSNSRPCGKSRRMLEREPNRRARKMSSVRPAGHPLVSERVEVTMAIVRFG